jgi:hypothetical protein
MRSFAYLFPVVYSDIEEGIMQPIPGESVGEEGGDK